MNAQLSVLENLIVCAVACIPIILVDPIARRFTSGWKKISESDPREHGEEVDCGALVFTLTFGGSLFSVMSMCVIFVLILSRAITAQIFLECFAVIATIGIGIDLTILTAPLIGTETSRRSP